LADLNKPRNPLLDVIDSIAERMSLDPSIPDERRAAFRLNAVHVGQQMVAAIIGGDLVYGWVMPPGQRLERRERVEAALVRGESVKVIAGRELVSRRWVEKVRAEAANRAP